MRTRPISIASTSRDGKKLFEEGEHGRAMELARRGAGISAQNIAYFVRQRHRVYTRIELL